MVLLVAGGGLHTIKSVKKALLNEPRTPVILLAGSGRAADVLAFALNMPDGGDE